MQRMGIVTIRSCQKELLEKSKSGGLDIIPRLGWRIRQSDQKVVDGQMEKDYKEVFEGIGKYKGPPVKIQVKEGGAGA